MKVIGVSQTVPFPGRLGLRRQVAERVGIGEKAGFLRAQPLAGTAQDDGARGVVGHEIHVVGDHHHRGQGNQDDHREQDREGHDDFGEAHQQVVDPAACVRAEHPEELTEQLGYLRDAAERHETDFSKLVISYQVTMNIGESTEQARSDFDGYISKYYPELSRAMDLSNWGPVGTPDDITAWLREFADRGVDHFICRFGAIDQFGQVERFAREILPAFSAERVR